jgi:hypothetical protein
MTAAITSAANEAFTKAKAAALQAATEATDSDTVSGTDAAVPKEAKSQAHRLAVAAARKARKAETKRQNQIRAAEFDTRISAKRGVILTMQCV